MKCLLFSLSLLVPMPILAAEYWPFHPDGVVYHYDNYTNTYGQWNGYSVLSRETNSGCHGDSWYTEINGRAALCGYISYCPGDFEAAWVEFDPPLPLTPLDPSPGETWVWESNQDRYPYVGGFVFGVVVGEETVTVPAGSFECLHVTLTPVGPPFFANFYLNRELGPIIWDCAHLVEIDGLTPIEPTSWGAVKSLFR